MRQTNKRWVDLGWWAGWLATLSFGEAKRNKFEKGLL